MAFNKSNYRNRLALMLAMGMKPPTFKMPRSQKTYKPNGAKECARRVRQMKLGRI